MKTQLQILRVAVFNKEDARPPTKLTVSYKGWWHLPKLHVPLALELLNDGIHLTRKAGKITLVQRFPDGKAPTFRVKGRDSQLEFRLYAGRSLRTRAEVNVGDLVSCTAERVMKVPFKEKVDGKVAKAFLSVAQITPFATPLPPPREIFPYRHKRDQNSEVPQCTFPLGEYAPTEARLKFLVKEMYGYGPMPDPKEWLLPPSNSSCHSLAEKPASPAASEDSVSRDAETVIMDVNSVPEDDGVVLNTSTAFDPVIDPSTHSGHRQENEEIGEGTNQSPQISPADCDADFVRLWEKVFGDQSDWQCQQEDEDKGTPQSPQITPVDCDADFVHLWEKVFGDQSDSPCQQEDEDNGSHQSPQITPADYGGARSVKPWTWGISLIALLYYALRLLGIK